MLREELDKLERRPFEAVEWRISIYGEDETDWSLLAKWVHDNNLVSPNLRWVIQVSGLLVANRKSFIQYPSDTAPLSHTARTRSELFSGHAA